MLRAFEGPSRGAGFPYQFCPSRVGAFEEIDLYLESLVSSCALRRVFVYLFVV